jgi:hypothetical protein
MAAGPLLPRPAGQQKLSSLSVRGPPRCGRRCMLTGLADGKKVSIEGTETSPTWPTLQTPSNAPNSRFGPHPSLRKGRSYHPAILLPREADDCRKLSYVPGRGGAGSQACGLVRMARTARHGGQDELAPRAQGARGHYGVPARQPPSRLPHLRPGRRVRSPGPVDEIRGGPRTLPRARGQACR